MNSTSNENLLIIFAKPPVAGLVKTRLIPALGKQGAADFQAKLLEHTLDKFSNNIGWQTQLWLSAELPRDFLHKLNTQFKLTCFNQQGENLGDKMYHAMAYSLENFDKVALVGTDCPALDSELIEKTFALLDQVDIVFTPAEDGGYVQIAARKVEPEVFQDIAWGSEKVMQQTRDNLKNTGLSMALTKMLWDIDLPQDLIRLQNRFYALAKDLPPEYRLDSQP